MTAPCASGRHRRRHEHRAKANGSRRSAVPRGGGQRPATRADSDFAVARYTSDGSLDATFGSGGWVTTDIDAASNDGAVSLAFQEDGPIVVVGTTQAGIGSDFAIARYDEAGTLDPNFGTGGIVVTDFDLGTDRATGVAIQGDGRIVVGGQSIRPIPGVGNLSDFALARYEGVNDPVLARPGRGPSVRSVRIVPAPTSGPRVPTFSATPRMPSPSWRTHSWTSPIRRCSCQDS